MTFENVRDPRVNASALNRTTRTMTRKPSVATATKCPDRRISTRPTSQAMALTRTAAINVAARNPTGTGPTTSSKWTPAIQDGRLGR